MTNTGITSHRIATALELAVPILLVLMLLGILVAAFMDAGIK